MTKADIVDRIAEKMSFKKEDSFQIVELVLEIMKATLGREDKIKISGFGNFVVREKSDRRGRNPQTGEEITISARRILTFMPSPLLKEALNKE